MKIPTLLIAFIILMHALTPEIRAQTIDKKIEECLVSAVHRADARAEAGTLSKLTRFFRFLDDTAECLGAHIWLT